MPLQHIKYLNPDCIIGIWHLTEPESFFLPRIEYIVADSEILSSIHHEKRRTEWLAGRYLVEELTRRINIPFDGIWTDEYNKPHLKLENASISISHASPYVVAILNIKSWCGIDVEELRSKLLPLSPKFLSDSELKVAGDSIERLAVFWGAKEALYKLHGRKSLIFKTNLGIEDVDFSKPEIRLKGVINLKDEHEQYRMQAGRFGNYVLVFTEKDITIGH
jgi:phosphopantetheinyl transferase